MKRMIMLLALIIFTSAFATVKISGYVYICDRCKNLAVCGQVRLYDESTGGVLLDSFCITPNGYYEFEVDENATYYLEIYVAEPSDMSITCYGFWESLDRKEVIVYSSDVVANLCGDVRSYRENPCDCL